MFGIKDKIASTGLKKVINGYLTGIGEVDKLDLDQKNKKIFVSINLEGEENPVTINVNRYELIRKGNSLFVRIVDITASKKWIEAAARKYGGNNIPVPDQYADIVEKIL